MNELQIPAKTFIKIFFALAVSFAVVKLMPLFGLIFMGLLLAVTLNPIIVFLKKKGLSKGWAVAVVTLLIIATILFIIMVLLPPIYEQIVSSFENYPKIRTEILSNIPEGSVLRGPINKFLRDPAQGDSAEWMKRLALVTGTVLEDLASVLLMLTFAIYLLVDGRRAFSWFKDFFSAPIREKLQKTADETSQVVFSYVAGQGITSLISTIYVYIILSVFHVPAALTLALLAGIFDVLPILGFFLSVIPAVLLSLTISSSTGIYVFMLYVLYHGIENYLIVPRVYGNRLRVSTLVVLISLIAAGELGGILWAVAILPVVASYPIIERIWLKEYLGDRVVDKHASD